MFLNCATAQDVLKSMKDNNVRMVDLRFADLPGTWQHFSVPPSALNEDAMSEGIGFDGSSIRGFQEIQESDMLVVPDPTTAFLDPFTTETTLVLICNIRDPLTGESYSRDPRYIAQKAEAHLKRVGVADVSYFGPEAEFFVFNDVRYGQGINYAYHEIDSKEGIWNSGKEEGPNLGHKPRQKEGYFPVPPIDSMQDLRSEMALTMESLGIPIEAHHHEVATAGQAEIDMRFTTLTRMADNLMISIQIRGEERRPQARYDGDVHAEAVVRRQRVGNARAPELVEGKHQPVPQRSRLCQPERACTLLYRRPAQACLGPLRTLRPDHELLSPAGAGLRGADQSGVFATQPLGLLPDSDVFAEPAGQARRVPHPRPLLQRLLGVRGDADGWPRWHRKPPRSGSTDRQEPL